MRYLSVVFGLFAILSVGVVEASAHVEVTPVEVGVGMRQVFTVSVLAEEEVATTALRLVIPPELEDVMPNVKPGWRVNMNENEIVWTGGVVPVGFADAFSFVAQVPDKAMSLSWVVYQSFEDGTETAWDQVPGSAGPYSVTRVVDDLAKPAEEATKMNESKKAMLLAIAALGLAGVCLAMQFGKISK